MAKVSITSLAKDYAIDAATAVASCTKRDLSEMLDGSGGVDTKEVLRMRHRAHIASCALAVEHAKQAHMLTAFALKDAVALLKSSMDY